MDSASIITAYRRYARTYDGSFGRVFHPGRKVAIGMMNCQPGQKVLEVGVGTGASLGLYPSTVKVTGIDISPHMLDIAKKKCADEKLTNCELLEMDSTDMTFPDSSFDIVVAMYVASVVPDPKGMVDEMKRVCKPDGHLYFINHFSHSNRIVGACETLLSPMSKLLGFRPAFDLDVFVEECDLEVLDNSPVNAFNYWSLIRATPNSPRGAKAKPAGRGVLEESTSHSR